MRTTAAVLRETSQDRPYAQSRPLSIEQLTLDRPGPGELEVRVVSAGVCHSDLSVVNGSRLRPLPMALGHEAAGLVTAVGPGVDDVVVDDHVVLVFVPSCGTCGFCTTGRPALCAAGAAANGRGELLHGGHRLRDEQGGQIHHHLGVSGFAEHAVVDRSSAVVIDRDVPFDVAAVLGCAMLTGFGAVQHTAQVQPGETVAVIGLGGVGQAAVLGAVAAGASVIVAIDPVLDKRELAMSLGSTHAAASSEAEAVVAAALPEGARWVFEAVGSASVMQQAFSLTGRGGTTVCIGLPTPDAQLTLPALAFVAEAKTMTGSYMGSAVPQLDIPRMVELWRQGRLPVERLISAVLPLSEINEAFEELAAARAVRQIIHLTDS